MQRESPAAAQDIPAMASPSQSPTDTLLRDWESLANRLPRGARTCSLGSELTDFQGVLVATHARMHTRTLLPLPPLSPPWNQRASTLAYAVKPSRPHNSVN